MAPSPPSIRSALRKIHPFLIQAQEQNLNEADTVFRIKKVFEDVLGYDGMTEITGEAQIKGKYADIAIKLENATRLLVEAKAAGSSLREGHTDQARSYAAESNLRWVVLTNGTVWNLYHLTFEEGIETDLVFSVDLGTGSLDEAADTLAILHRDSIRKDLHETLWRRKCALSPQSVAKALFTERVIRLMRRDIRRSEGVSIDEEDLVAAIRDLFSTEARDQIGPVKIKKQKKKKAGLDSKPATIPQPPIPGEPCQGQSDQAKSESPADKKPA